MDKSGPGVSLLFLLLGVRYVSALTGTNNLGCSAVDENGYLYLPDYPVDKHHLSGVTNFTVGQELRIYSFTPNCTGESIGADFCFHYQNVSTVVYLRQVLSLIEFKREGDKFVPKNNSTRLLQALPIDRTRCISAEPLQGLLCCARMTFFGNGPIPLTAGEELVFAILAKNRDIDYPVLKYRTAAPEYQVRTFEVDITSLPAGQSSIFDHVYDSSNTREDITTFPILRFVVEPNEKNATTSNSVSVADPSSTETTSLIASFSTIIAILLIASILLIIGLVIVTVLYCKQKKSAAKKKDTTPFREYMNQLDATLRANQEEPPSDAIMTAARTRTTPFVSAPPPYTPANVIPKAKISLKAEEAIYEDTTGTGGSPVVLSRVRDFNSRNKHTSRKQGASA